MTRNREFPANILQHIRGLSAVANRVRRTCRRFSSVQIRTIQDCLSTANPIAVIVGPAPIDGQDLPKSLIRRRNAIRDWPLRSDEVPGSVRTPRVPAFSRTGGDGGI